MKANRQLSLPLTQQPVKGRPVTTGHGSVRRSVLATIAADDAPSRPTPDEARAGARAIADRLGRLLGKDVEVVVTDNRSSLVTARWDEDAGRYVFRVHHMFLHGDERTINALSDFGSGRRKKSAGQLLDAFIESQRERIRKDPAAGPRAPAPPQGRHHDLQEIFDQLNAEYFGDRVVARIGWGESRGHGRRRRSIKMGSYVHDARLIRVHPALDKPQVPVYYVAWVVYHEMLHQVVEPLKRNGRTYFHSAEFRKLERAYKDSDLAQAWEDRHFDLLLRG